MGAPEKHEGNDADTVSYVESVACTKVARTIFRLPQDGIPGLLPGDSSPNGILLVSVPNTGPRVCAVPTIRRKRHHEVPTSFTMSTSHASSGQSNPQVVVRAGKYFLCSACGTMVQVPEDVVGQLVTTFAATSRELPEQAPTAEQAPSEQEPVAETIAATTPPTASVAAKTKAKTSSRVRLHFERIDGLVVPTSKQLDRALAWVSFHLKVLDRQGTELHRLKKQCQRCQASQVPCPRPRGHAFLGQEVEEHLVPAVIAS